MVAVLVVLTIAALIALDFFVLRKRRAVAPEPALAMPGLEPLSEAAARLPWGVFLQPTFTWTRIEPDGSLLVGLHPLLLGIVGAPYDIELLDDGETVGKGEPLVRIGKSGRHLTVRSPVAGRVTEINRVVQGETDFAAVAKDGGSWLYRITPQHVGDEVPGWLIGERAVEWTRRQYDRVREHMLSLVGPGEVGAVLADGGELLTGVLGQLDAAAWEEFERSFLKA
jgi:glycine cleavage system H lipoate-binding protein